jgi:hypothetical protein
VADWNWVGVLNCNHACVCLRIASREQRHA